jgi:DNA-binding SARP family transcriptional activator
MNGHSAHLPARIAFRVLGPLEVDGPDGTPIDVCGGKPATMLTLLLLHRNAWVSTDQLIDAVWAGRETPASAQRNLKTYVWQLRRALPDERIESRPGAYRVTVLPGELDADVAAGLSEQAGRLLADGSAAKAAVLVERALGLWRGCPYDGLTGDASTAIDRLTELHRSLREDLADAHLALGRPADGITLLRALTDEEPLREHGWTKLMGALHRTGRRHDALAAYQRVRTALVHELGIEPGAELTMLHQQILNDHATEPKTASTGVSNLPARTAGFVGRTSELATITSACSDGVTVVTVDGMPGIGKTALVLEAAAAFGRPDGRLYLDLQGSLTTTVALGKLIRMVRDHDTATGSLPEAKDELAALWRSLGQDIVLVLDDVIDAEQVRDLLPSTPGCVVLVTSRSRLAGLDRSAAVSLDVLPASDAEQLGPEEVLRWCGGHPAAIRLLADRLRDRQPWTAARLASRWEDSATRCRELAEVHAGFESAYRGLSEPVRRFYRLLSLTPQFDVRRAARLVGASQQEVEPMLDDLMDQHLVAEPAPGRFALHPIARDHAHVMLLATESEDELVAAADRVRLGGQAGLGLVTAEDPRVA